MRIVPDASGRRRAAFALILLLGAVAGCPEPPVGVPPQGRREALQRVNENIVHLNEAISAPALASFEFVDADGRTRTFLGHEARILFMPPRYLLVDVRSLVGTVAQFGTNDERYWAYVDLPDLKRLWHGTWAAGGQGGRAQLPIPPADLLDALMLQPLPETVDNGLLPVLRMEGDDHRLLFMRLDVGGQPRGWREVRLDPAPPYQPIEIVDRDAEGRVLMHASLGDYRRIERDGPFTPRRYDVSWPGRAEMTLRITGVRLRPDLGPTIFAFPAGWRHESFDLDADGVNE